MSPPRRRKSSFIRIAPRNGKKRRERPIKMEPIDLEEIETDQQSYDFDADMMRMALSIWDINRYAQYDAPISLPSPPQTPSPKRQKVLPSIEEAFPQLVPVYKLLLPKIIQWGTTCRPSNIFLFHTSGYKCTGAVLKSEDDE